MLKIKDEIKVGDYVRLNRNQGINKIIEIEDDFRYSLENEIADEYGEITDCICKYSLEDEILNYKTNIIDLIEEGDIVLYKLNNFNQIKIGRVEKQIDPRSMKEALRVEFYRIDQVKVLKIITKEQFENIGYEV